MAPQATSSSASGHALRLRDVFAGYQQIPVVRNLNLEVAPGEVVALLGPNGAGKTTTLETIAGLNRPISGVIEMSGEYVGGTPAHVLARRGLALVPEGRALFPGLTVREHLRLAGGRGGSGERELLEMLPELEKCLHRKAGLLSGGGVCSRSSGEWPTSSGRACCSSSSTSPWHWRSRTEPTS